MMKPSTDGQLFAEQPVLLPIVSRLQADVYPEGYADLAMWGAGSFGRVRFSPIKGAYTHETGPFHGSEKPGNASTQSSSIRIAKATEPSCSNSEKPRWR